MDEIVRQAMAKWPNVPHCYGWLALDARGLWRMRDDRAQAMKLPGDRIANSALLSFINRNYQHDPAGRWYFQNGPQRVYVDLEVTPYIARTDPAEGFLLHTNEPLAAVDTVWMTRDGQMLLEGDGRIALLDDRDVVHCLPALHLDGETASDDALLQWLNKGPETAEADQADTEPVMTLRTGTIEVPVRRLDRDRIADRFGFVKTPRGPDQVGEPAVTQGPVQQ